MSAPSKRNCPAPGCQRSIRGDFLMCAVHWRMVRRSTQNDVWAAFEAYVKRTTPENLKALRDVQRKAIEQVTEAMERMV